MSIANSVCRLNIYPEHKIYPRNLPRTAAEDTAGT